MVEATGKITANEVFDNPIRLKLYLYLRKQDSPVGIRETQRALGITSPSTVSWHLDKLVEHEYVSKSSENGYVVDNTKKFDSSIAVQVSFTAKLFRDRLVSPLSFIFYFQLAMVIITFFTWIQLRNPLYIGFQGFFSLLVSVVVVFYIWRQVRKELLQFDVTDSQAFAIKSSED